MALNIYPQKPGEIRVFIFTNEVTTEKKVAYLKIGDG